MSSGPADTALSHEQSLYAERISALRSAMQAAEIQAYILPSADPHQSEYLPDHFASRAWFSGFSGSAGVAVVTLDGGGVWTDSRYFVQARKELAERSRLEMFPAAQGGQDYVNWLAEELPGGSVVGLDARLFTVADLRNFKQTLEAAGLELRSDLDLVSEAWPDRPALPATRMYTHELEYAGRSAMEKISDLRKAMKERDLSHTLVTALDELAWLLNVRASDVQCNPVALGYVLVSLEKVMLFTAPQRIDEQTLAGFRESGIEVHPYERLEAVLSTLPDDARVGIDEHQVNAYLAEVLGAERYVAWPSVIRQTKAQKNETEIAHTREAHLLDSVALVRAFRWLDEQLAVREIAETEFAEVLHRERAKMPGFVGDSFEAIVAYGPNAALPHYRAIEGEEAMIRPKGILLVDSGGQYLSGTTDITRTIAVGEVSAVQKRNNTLVLKGMIALSQAVFPKGTRGIQLDTLARQFLWQHQLNFGHGTGHGVGFFLNVHEPPQGFTPTLSERGRTIFQPGMITSNEPGYYEEGAYGIRIENLLLSVELDKRGEWLGFETLTFFPIDLALVDWSLVTDAERQWLEDYHRRVWESLSDPRLGSVDSSRLEGPDLEWLRKKCGIEG